MTSHKNIIGLCVAIAVLMLDVFVGVPIVAAATNISSTTGKFWAWNEAIGWLQFNTPSNSMTVTVTSTQLTGYASSSVGDVSLDCATTSNGNICATSNYKVTNNGAGSLSGWGWSDQYGWISFDCNNNASCGTSNYQVSIDSSGNFQSYAWNDVVGWISFNCGNHNGCATSSYKVVTTWANGTSTSYLDSSVIDSQVSSGVQLNSVLWQGSLPSGTSVRFQFATSNSSSGPWTYIGSDGTGNTYYTPSAPGSSLKLETNLHNNQRYFRYRIWIFANQSLTLTPRVDDVIINYSP